MKKGCAISHRGGGRLRKTNDHTEWQKFNPLSRHIATLAPQTRQARAGCENLNYETLAPHARQARPSGEILNYLLSRQSDILK